MTDDEKPLSRRRVLAGLATTLAPSVAFAQSAGESLNQLVPPVAIPQTTLSPAIAPKSIAPIDKNRSYVLFFQQAVDVNSIKTLRNNLVALAEDGMSEVVLVISSTGGLVLQAMQIYSLIQSLPMKIVTHAQGAVQSAANVLFLAGAERSADPGAVFTIHPVQGAMFGLLNVEQAEKEIKKIKDSQDQFDALYRQRTKLPEKLIQDARVRDVAIDAQHALEYGFVSRVGDIKLPTDKKVKFVFPD